MQELTKDSQVAMNDGEVISIQEYLLRTFPPSIADRMGVEHRAHIRSFVEQGAAFDDIWPFYDRFISEKTRAAMMLLDVDAKELFKRIHDACVQRCVE